MILLVYKVKQKQLRPNVIKAISNVIKFDFLIHIEAFEYSRNYAPIIYDRSDPPPDSFGGSFPVLNKTIVVFA